MVALIASAGWWQFGIALGVAVIAVAAVIVITIVVLAMRIAKQAKTAEGAVEVVRQQTAELGGIARINDSRCGSSTPLGHGSPARRRRWALITSFAGKLGAI